MTRQRWFTLGGAWMGAAVALYVAWWERDYAAVHNAASAGFGASIALFVISLPWSIAVWLVMVIGAYATGADGPEYLRPFFYAMPIVAGLGWSWVTERLYRWFAKGLQRAG